jgi:hypothetical protein
MKPDVLKKYQALWSQHYAKKSTPDWNNTTTVTTKRRMLDMFGQWLEGQPDDETKALGVSVRIYARLPIASADTLPKNSFYPSADLVCKKKWTQMESKSKEIFKGSGTTIVRIANNPLHTFLTLSHPVINGPGSAWNHLVTQ